MRKKGGVDPSFLSFYIILHAAKKVSRGDNIAPPDPFQRVALPQHHQTTL
jgi:hypothetical protein